MTTPLYLAVTSDALEGEGTEEGARRSLHLVWISKVKMSHIVKQDVMTALC